MKWIMFLFVFLFVILLLIVYMVKVAFENNIKSHVLKLSGSGTPLRIFFISDTHARSINKKMIQSLEGNFDAVIIGGDFADERTDINCIHENLKLLTSLGPTFFVWGNNDREVGEEKLLQIFAHYGVTVVANDAVILHERNPRIWLGAIDDISTNNNSIADAFVKVEKENRVFFVSHNPAVFPNVCKKYHVDLMLGGHLHGGQIRFGPFGIHPHGTYRECEGCMTLISNGYGTTLLPLRLGARPECHVINISFTA